jgi:hypothetical protein
MSNTALPLGGLPGGGHSLQFCCVVCCVMCENLSKITS